MSLDNNTKLLPIKYDHWKSYDMEDYFAREVMKIFCQWVSPDRILEMMNSIDMDEVNVRYNSFSSQFKFHQLLAAMDMIDTNPGGMFSGNLTEDIINTGKNGRILSIFKDNIFHPNDCIHTVYWCKHIAPYLEEFMEPNIEYRTANSIRRQYVPAPVPATRFQIYSSVVQYYLGIIYRHVKMHLLYELDEWKKSITTARNPIPELMIEDAKKYYDIELGYDDAVILYVVAQNKCEWYFNNGYSHGNPVKNFYYYAVRKLVNTSRPYVSKERI